MENTEQLQKPLPVQDAKKAPPQLLIAFLVVMLPVVGAVGYLVGKQSVPQMQTLIEQEGTPLPTTNPDEGIACTMDAKICPDGSAVGRTGPNCEFAACPGETAAGSAGKQPERPGQQKYNSNLGFSLYYPSQELVSCPTSEKAALLLWTAPFDCPVAHDSLYEVAVREFTQAEYKQTKKPVSTKSIQVAGVTATQKNYVYTQDDGPLFSTGGMTEVLLPLKGKLVQLTFFGTDQAKQQRFQQILDSVQVEQ